MINSFANRIQSKLLIEPKGEAIYIPPPKPFDPFVLLRNPQYFLMTIMVLMMFCMPYLMEMVKEQQAELLRERAAQRNRNNNNN